MNTVRLSLFNNLKSVYYCQVQRQSRWPDPREWTNGVECHGFTYYPRSPDEKDPPVSPPKLFMVQRIKPFWGNFYKFKDILTDMGLGKKEKMSKVVIVKNIPELNKKLWQIKHLVKITPIKFLNGEPTAEDIKNIRINEWGEVTITKEIGNTHNVKLEETDKFLSDPLHLDADTKIRDTRLKWLNPYK